MTRQDILTQIDAIATARLMILQGGVSSHGVAGGENFVNLSLPDLAKEEQRLNRQLFLLDNSQDGTKVRIFPQMSSNNSGTGGN